MTWNPYLDTRLISPRNGFVVIKPSDAEPAIPLNCSVCKTLFRNRDDEEAFLELSCCHFCAITWAHARKKEWNEGWRPTKSEIEEAVLVRSPLSIVLDLD